MYIYIYIKNKLPLYLQCKEDWINRIILIVQREVIFIVGHTIIFIITERINFNHVYIYISAKENKFYSKTIFKQNNMLYVYNKIYD